MKFIKGLLTFIVSVVLIVLVLAFTIISAGKDMVQHQAVKSYLINEVEANADEEIAKSVEKLVSSDIADDMLDSIFKDFINYNENSSYEISDKSVDLIIQYCEENQEELEELSDGEFEISDLKKKDSRKELKRAIKDAFGDVDEDVQDIIKVYGTATSKETSTKMLLGIVALVVILALLSWSAYKWLLPCGVSLIIAGVLASIVFFGMNLIIKFIIASENFDEIIIDPKAILIAGIVEIVVGIAMIVVRSKISKNASNKTEETVNENV